ncbi:hypothetical protein [Magnetococcus sp. PR-3]|uniref:hypothetical protein n=1 Tax=Magnetococcus sp. PR-3 TaxID=3120355 RepID=UPI002FCE6242
MDKAKKMFSQLSRVAGLTAALLVLSANVQAAEVIRGQATNHLFYPAYAFQTSYPSKQQPVMVMQWAPTGPTFYTMGDRQIPLNVVYPTSQKQVIHGKVVMSRVMRFVGLQ